MSARSGGVGCFSFNGNKLITTGGGGMLVTDDEALARRARHLSTQARLPGLAYDHDEVGYNYRLTNLAAALGLAQLEQLGELLAARRANAAAYDAAIAGDALAAGGAPRRVGELELLALHRGRRGAGWPDRGPGRDHRVAWSRRHRRTTDLDAAPPDTPLSRCAAARRRARVSDLRRGVQPPVIVQPR